MEEVVTFEYMLRQAVAPAGIAMLAAFLLSFVVDFWNGYNALSPKRKRLVYYALCLIVPVICYLLMAAMGVFAWSVNLVWLILSAWFAAVFGGTLLHTRELPAK